MPVVREWLVREGLYDRALDSLDLPCNAPRADFGVHASIEGVSVSFCPFYFDGGALVQRNAALARFEGFDALFEARIPGISEGDFVEVRELPGMGAVGISTLEACRAAKGASGRAKDAHDVAEIDRMGCDSARLARVEAAWVTRPPSAFSSSIARIDAAPSMRSVERTIASTDSLGRVFNGVPFIGRPFLGARHRGKEASGA